ncbi:sensor histidine kinase [Vallitalea maricola]|uniref:HAMP domain-containing sensor histidine kinase n=1 Tax=Vallitalea maricola TaxID=3074433 RepID=A0ACB5UQM8_9FIRM|nr:HAMP domain-containing sensor histidine kinase [Vallitalea sp. AN17-2]
MTIRKQFIWIIILMIFFAIIMNSIISSSYIDNYFKGYVTEQYDSKVDNIKNYAINILTESSNSYSLKKELNNYISDPIVQITIVNRDGVVVLVTRDEMFFMHNNMMGNSMMMGNKIETEEDYFNLKADNEIIGMLFITRSNSIQNSETVKLFKKSLIFSNAISGILVLILAIFITAFVSTKMTKDLRMTAMYAKRIEVDSENRIKHSKVLEIRDIQTSLENLSSKLKLQKQVRQEKVDQLSHEVRTPITILKTHFEGALDGIVKMNDDELESCLNEINNLSGILANINDVIEYSDEDVQIKNERFDLINELNKILKGFTLQFQKKGIALLLKGMENLEITNDKSMLSQTIYNLLTNAYKFTNQGGQVEVSIEMKSQDTVIISVSDTGIGINYRDIEKIFDAYYRSASTTSIQGEGLGLYIAKRNIKAIGGKIYVKSREEGGTSFIIEIPILSNTDE